MYLGVVLFVSLIFVVFATNVVAMATYHTTSNAKVHTFKPTHTTAIKTSNNLIIFH